AVVEVIDEASLRRREEIAVAERGEHEDFPEAHQGRLLRMRGGFKPNMLTCVSHERDRQQCPEDRIANPQINRHWPKTVSGGEITGEKRRDAYGEIAGEFVEADGQAARRWPHQIERHGHDRKSGNPTRA